MFLYIMINDLPRGESWGRGGQFVMLSLFCCGQNEVHFDQENCLMLEVEHNY